MQLAILADIHANALALEAVLEDAYRRGITEFVDLGDVLYGPLEPKRTYNLLQTVNLIAQVSGNQDRFIRDSENNAQARAKTRTLDFVIRDLDDERINYLRQLPQTAIVETEILLCHGSPSNDTTYLLEDVSTGTPRVRQEHEIEEDLEGAGNATVVLCGHTHVPRLVQLKSGTLILNPGSVGLPAYDDDTPVPHFMESFSPHASYAVLEKINRGWAAAFHRIPYDWHAAAAQARELGRPDWARGIEYGRMQ